MIQDRFFPQAKALRKEFDRRFADPLASDSRRFVWDYWHVPDQYTAIRTPAYHFFPKKLYADFHRALLKFGREQLGCFDVTPPWLSYYVDGCGQQPHADLPHGPWAFVYSLTEWDRREFTGGETFLFKPRALAYWPSLGDPRHEGKGVEKRDLIEKVPPRFNRLFVFDPRVPHGVEPVRGVSDPRKARLVIHGWFTEPQPYVEGSLTRGQVAGTIREVLGEVHEVVSHWSGIHGTYCVRLTIGPSGVVQQVKELTQTLVSLETGSTQELAPFRQALRGRLQTLRFPKARGTSRLTLPLMFR
ncbi:MAG: 2OG-Fe(II) oxygenase [Bacteriovoracia bacterium]